MGRRIDVDDLMSADEIAARLAYRSDRKAYRSGKVVYDWVARDVGFPEPVKVIGNVRVWAWPDVQKWAQATGRL